MMAGGFGDDSRGFHSGILTFATTATNGWACEASDLTTRADAVQQTAYTTTTATFTGTMVSADLVTFHCFAF